MVVRSDQRCHARCGPAAWWVFILLAGCSGLLSPSPCGAGEERVMSELERS
jgi:hypothetical protein